MGEQLKCFQYPQFKCFTALQRKFEVGGSRTESPAVLVHVDSTCRAQTPPKFEAQTCDTLRVETARDLCRMTLWNARSERSNAQIAIRNLSEPAYQVDQQAPIGPKWPIGMTVNHCISLVVSAGLATAISELSLTMELNPLFETS